MLIHSVSTPSGKRRISEHRPNTARCSVLHLASHKRSQVGWPATSSNCHLILSEGAGLVGTRLASMMMRLRLANDASGVHREKRWLATKFSTMTQLNVTYGRWSLTGSYLKQS
jgi:hypothetical protein